MAIKGKIEFDRAWLEDATKRNLVQWALIFELNPNLLQKTDSFIDWAKRCNVDIRPMDEGGAVVKRTQESGFQFIDANQMGKIEEELKAIQQDWDK